MVGTQGIIKSFFIFGWLLCISLTHAQAQDTSLVQLLVQQLGVTQQQAEGGAGAIFQTAKKNLSPEEFSSIADKTPEVDTMMAAAPEMGGGSKALGGFGSMLGSSSSSLGGMADLASAFNELGLSSEMVGKFTPIILDYVKEHAGETAMTLLKGALI